jgi:predicted GTPase
MVLTIFSSDVESLKNGIITTSKNKAKAPYTTLLVGETGVGKSSVFELIANVLAGNDVDHYDFDILDHTNERGSPDNQSQTNSARLCELTSKDGTVVSVGLFERGG